MTSAENKSSTQPNTPVTGQRDPGIEALERALKASFHLLQLLLVVLVALFLASGFFTVEEDKVGLVLHFGKIRQGRDGKRAIPPGPHWAWPDPIDKVIRIPARDQSLTLNSFWYHDQDEITAGGDKKVPQTLLPGVDGYCVTGDGNILHSSWSVRYRIQDAASFYLVTNGEGPRVFLDSLLSSAVLHSVSGMMADQALLTDLEKWREQVHRGLQARLDALELGIQISRLDLVRNAPPRQTKEAFDDAIKAGNEKRLKIEEAKAEANRIRQNALGDSARIRSEAQAYKVRVELETKAEAENFTQLLPSYRKDPAGFLHRLYMENVPVALARAKEKFLLSPDKDGHQRILQIEMEGRSKYRTREKPHE